MALSFAGKSIPFCPPEKAAVFLRTGGEGFGQQVAGRWPFGRKGVLLIGGKGSAASCGAPFFLYSISE